MNGVGGKLKILVPSLDAIVLSKAFWMFKLVLINKEFSNSQIWTELLKDSEPPVKLIFFELAGGTPSKNDCKLSSYTPILDSATNDSFELGPL